jgi:hypothetical protein
VFKNLIKACAASLIVAAPAFAADVDGVFKGQGAKGPVVLELHAGQRGYLTGELHCNHSTFAVVAKQDGDELAGIFGAPGVMPMQFTGSVEDNGALTVTCNGSTIELKHKTAAKANDNAADAQAAEAQAQAEIKMRQYIAQHTRPAAVDNNNTDTAEADYMATAREAARERQAMQAGMYGSQNSQPTAMDQSNTNSRGTYGAYGQMPVQTNAGYNGGGYQAGGNYQDGASYSMPQAQSYPNAGAGYGYAAPYVPAQSQQPAVSYNHPDDGSASMQQYEQYQAVQDQISLQRSDAMRDQSRFIGADGTQIIAPDTATQVTVDQAGQATYTTEQAPAAPPMETVAQPYTYTAPTAEPAAE